MGSHRVGHDLSDLAVAAAEKKEVITGKNWRACKQIWKGFKRCNKNTNHKTRHSES